MPYCAISACRHISNKNNLRNGGISYHRFPHDPGVREKWTFATGRKLWMPTKLSTICSAHFKDDDFAEKISGNRFLKQGSVPSLNVWINQSTIESNSLTNNKADVIDEKETTYDYNTTNTDIPVDEKPKTKDSTKRKHHLHTEYEGQSTKKSQQDIEDIKIDYDNIDKFGEQIVFLLKRIPRQLCRELQESIVTLVKTERKKYGNEIKKDITESTSSSSKYTANNRYSEHTPIEEITIKVEPYDMKIEDESALNEDIKDIERLKLPLDQQNPKPMAMKLFTNKNTVKHDTLQNDRTTNDDCNYGNTQFFHRDSFIEIEIRKADQNDEGS